MGALAQLDVDREAGALTKGPLNMVRPVLSHAEAPVNTMQESAPLAQHGVVSPGKRAEICYDGTWLEGVVHSIDDDTVTMQLDIDREAGCFTKGPLSMVRPIASKPEGPVFR